MEMSFPDLTCMGITAIISLSKSLSSLFSPTFYHLSILFYAYKIPQLIKYWIMKNMKGSTIFMKLKSISSPTWNPIQLFHTSTPAKEHNVCTSDILEDFNDDKTGSGPNAEEKLARSNTKPDKFMFSSVGFQEQVQLLAEFDTSLEMVTSCCQSTTVQIKSSYDSIPLQPSFKPRSMEDHVHRNNAKNAELHLPLPTFEEKCPPGGKESVIFYTTNLRGIRKTFEDCNKIRFLLESFKVMYYERDVSMDLEYREELWGMLGGRVVPPRLFVRGKYIGGAEEVVGLHEKGMLRNLLEGIPLSPLDSPCLSCGGLRFTVCSKCNGSKKALGENNEPVKCCDCNENGLVKCSVCSQEHLLSVAGSLIRNFTELRSLS